MPPRKSPSRTTTPRAAAKAPSARTSGLKALAPARKPDREPPGPRRAIFIDVENTSGEEAIVAALGQIGFEKVTPSTELVAVGNWRVIGAHVGRMLASRGARLIHTAPATGVKDWSDLSIAVAAGTWLGRAAAGDTIEIISADRAFDAVGDTAAALGVTYRRIAYAGAPAAAHATERTGRRRSRRGGRRGGRGARAPLPAAAAPEREPAEIPAAPAAAHRAAASHRAGVSHRAAAAEPVEKDIHAAPSEKIVETIARLTNRAPERGVNLDLLISALKSEGYGRPPGSPRLVTRLRMLKDVEVSPTGMVRLVPGAVISPPPPEEPAADTEPVSEPASPAEPRRRPRRRGGRRRRGAAASDDQQAADAPSS